MVCKSLRDGSDNRTAPLHRTPSPRWSNRLRTRRSCATRPYLEELRLLQIELLKLQRHVVESGQKVVILFEGRDAAGKGGSIRRFTEHLNPRSARTVALPKPTDTERGQWYFQRYTRHLPTAGEIVFFDRSWYNRAGVERVMGFCTPKEYGEFFRQVPGFERSLVESGISLFKLWFTVSRHNQEKRFSGRLEDPLRQWKFSPMDQESQPPLGRVLRRSKRDAHPRRLRRRAVDRRELQREEAGPARVDPARGAHASTTSTRTTRWHGPPTLAWCGGPPTSSPG